MNLALEWKKYSMLSQLHYRIQMNRVFNISSEEVIYVAFLLFFFLLITIKHYDSLIALIVSDI